MKGRIAIKGNAEKGPEIIKLLEMMGGNNSKHFTGRDSSRYYFIDNNTKCICDENIYEMEKCYNGVYMLFSYDTFNDNYPWRIGDIVNVIGRNNRIGLKIVKMQWGDTYNTMMYCLDCGQDGYGWWRAEDIEYTKYSELKVNLDDIAKNIEFDLSKYSYKVKNGKLIIKEKKPVYPKTYEECCEVIGINQHDVEIDLPQPYQQKMFNLFKLRICCDAYRKIVGEKMGLDKPWEPEYPSNHYIFTIETNKNQIICNAIINTYKNRLLSFPTKEMRDAFYENFKKLIEDCKEFL